MIKIVVYALTFEAFATLANAQPFAIPECRSGNFIVNSEPYMGRYLYIAQNTVTGKKDTLLGAESPKMCAASDSSVAFLSVYNTVYAFRFNKNRWGLALMEVLPMPVFQGNYDKDGKYVVQKCELLDASHVRFVQTRQKPDGSEREGKETIYRLDLSAQKMVVEKETRLE